ncbi:MAG: TIGR04211 family SH3 domain-containing protein [Thiohalocapsa sp.]
MTRLLLILLLAVALPPFATPARAETRYVTDQYDFNLRAGESNRYKIIRTLPSGTPLEIIAINKKNNYAHVRTDDGKTGYILTRYLQPEAAARSQIADMKGRLEELQQAPDKLASRLSKLQQDYENLRAGYETLDRNKETLEQELAEVRHASANAVRINQERQQLQGQVAGLTEQIGDLEHRNRELANHRDQRWFMIGAGVVAGGILIGLILPNLRLRRRRNSWGSL